MTFRIGSLCTGYGGLDLAVESVLGGEFAWVADNDLGAAAILAHRFPSVPNLADITVTDWAAVEPVDVLAAGFPCQDLELRRPRRGNPGRQPKWTLVHHRRCHRRTTTTSRRAGKRGSNRWAATWT